MTEQEFTANYLKAHHAALLEDIERQRATCLQDRNPLDAQTHWPHSHLAEWNFYMDTTPNEGANSGLVTEYHDRGGMTYARLKCGCVAISSWLPDLDHQGTRIWRREILTVIEPNVWASIVCGVSAGGETGERYEFMRRFHD